MYRLHAALPALGKMNPWWLRVGKHSDLRKRVLESFRLKDTIRVTDSACYGPRGEPKDSVDQDTPGSGTTNMRLPESKFISDMPTVNLTSKVAQQVSAVPEIVDKYAGNILRIMSVSS